MSFSHTEAKFLAGYILASYEYERGTTKKVIAAIPEGQGGYTPDGKSMPALKLAFHIASSELFFLNGVLSGEFKMPEKIEEPPSSAEAVLSWYDANLPEAIDKVRAMPGEALAREVDFFGMMKRPAVDFLNLMLHHSIHHRGQLSAYLRPMGAKVPGIYGPSGDSQ
ncbi:MAG: DinB family protein [Acidobacteria bacterium]|nr:DinB family protein [Acidobacteriota bacterium]